MMRWRSGGATYTCDGRIGSPSRGCAAGNGPARERMRGSTLVLSSGKCIATKTGAAKSAGSSRTTRVTASTPPADAPITTIEGLLITLERSRVAGQQHGHARARMAIRMLRVADAALEL